MIPYNFQSSHWKKSIVKQFLEKCDVFYLQETLLTQLIENELDDLTDDNTINSFTRATLSAFPNGGRPAGDLAMFWKVTDTINFFPIMFTNRITI